VSIVITGGGTGGHLVIAKAIKEELNKRGIKPIFIGSSNGQDRAWFEDDEGWEDRYFLDTQGVVNKSGFKKIASLYNISKEILKVKRIFDRYKVDKVISVGGYSAAPASFAAIIYRKNYFIHEQNSVMGRLNSLLKPFAKKIFQDPKYYPIRDTFFKNQRVRESIKTIIFLGGSQGAKSINEFAFKIAPLLKKRGINIIHQTGKRDFDRAYEFYKKSGIDADVFDFSKELDKKIQKADFAISRAGAGTIWELSASGVVSLFVPYPYAAANHQYHNAKFLAEQNLALLVEDSKLDVDVVEKIFELDIKKMSQALIDLTPKDGAKNIVDDLLSAK